MVLSVRAIDRVERPSSASKMIRARNTSRCSVVGARTRASSTARSSGVSRTSAALGIIPTLNHESWLRKSGYWTNIERLSASGQRDFDRSAMVLFCSCHSHSIINEPANSLKYTAKKYFSDAKYRQLGRQKRALLKSLAFFAGFDQPTFRHLSPDMRADAERLNTADDRCRHLPNLLVGHADELNESVFCVMALARLRWKGSASTGSLRSE
jgi:hypothetical protein